jgi:hypothetical protein
LLIPVPIDKRKAEAERIKQKYSDRIPVRLVPFPYMHHNTDASSSTSSRSPSFPLTFPPHLLVIVCWRSVCGGQVICEKVKDSDIALLDKKKYLVPKVCSPSLLLIVAAICMLCGGCGVMQRRCACVTHGCQMRCGRERDHDVCFVGGEWSDGVVATG